MNCTKMDVSVIIVTYNTYKITSECIESIFKQKCPLNYEVILVDNSSTDESKEIFSHDPRIKYIYSEENLGFGKANNLGYKFATGKYIFFLNSDTLLVNDAISSFYKVAEESESNEACWGTTLMNQDGKYIHSYSKFPTVTNYIKKYLNNYTRFLGWNLLIPNTNLKYPDKFPNHVDYITGADLFIKKSVIEEHGLFNPSFFMYYEESEMQYRLNKNKYKSVLINTPLIIHLEGGSKKKSLKSWGIELVSSFTYAKLCFPYPQYILIRLLALILIPKVLIYPSTRKEKKITLKSIIAPIRIIL